MAFLQIGLSISLVLALAPAAQARPPAPRLVPERTSVSDLALLSPGSDSLPRSDWPLRPGEGLRLTYPLPIPATEVSPYGWRYSESRDLWRMHVGQDLIAPEGTPVLAMMSGKVRLVQPVSGYGLTVLLDHGRGWQTLYAHLLNASLHPGQLIKAGEPLGSVGRSGNASVAHLHVELRRIDGGQAYALDPAPLLSSDPLNQRH